MTGRRAIFLTARRELRERGRSRAFVIGTVVQVAVLIAIVVIASVADGDQTERYDLGTVGASSAEVASIAEAQQEALDIELDVKTYEGADSARAAVEDDELDMALTDDALITGADGPEALIALVQEAARDTKGTGELRDQGLSDAEIKAALEPEPLAVEEVGKESGADIAFLASLLLYVAIIGAGYAVATGVVEEKASRVVEVILSAIKPVYLLTGKVLGIGLLSLGQVLIVVLSGLAAAMATGAIDLPDSTASTTVLIAVYFVLGYLLYACAFAIAGAIVSRQEDVQNSTGPLMLVLIAAYLVAISVADSPQSTLAVIATFVPPVAPMVVPARAAQDALPLGELAISLVLMVLAAAFLLWVAAKVYDRTVLRMGAPIKLREALRLSRS
ncbi:MAG TPA: ABC transporter permease [Solirubrobacterales bacterium]|nr:ABC transporter permease [Solirubrobacterales bacterium]